MNEVLNKSTIAIPNLSNKDGFPVVVVTHPRSGTHLTIDLLRRNFQQLKSTKPRFAPLDALYVALDVFFLENTSVSAQKRAIAGLSRHRYPIIKSHWVDPDYLSLAREYQPVADWLRERGRVIYVVRNPESVLASTFLFEQGFLNISAPSNRSGWLLSKAAYWVKHVTKWTSQEQVLVLRFEDIVKETNRHLEKIGEFLDLSVNPCVPPLPPRMNGKWAGRLSRLRTNPPTTEILNQHGRTTLDKLFDPAAVSDCHAMIAETAAKFGYDRQPLTGS